MTEQKQMPTKEQWAKIVEDLNSLYIVVYLRCDGYLVSASLRRTSKLKLSIVVGVNGWEIKGEWLPSPSKGRAMSEEAQRFWFQSRRQKYSAKQLQSLEKIWGKRECRKRGLYDPFIFPTPEWNSANSLIRHLKANNDSIEIIDYETYSKEIAVIRAKEAEHAGT